MPDAHAFLEGVSFALEKVEMEMEHCAGKVGALMGQGVFELRVLVIGLTYPIHQHNENRPTRPTTAAGVVAGVMVAGTMMMTRGARTPAVVVAAAVARGRCGCGGYTGFLGSVEWHYGPDRHR